MATVYRNSLRVLGEVAGVLEGELRHRYSKEGVANANVTASEGRCFQKTVWLLVKAGEASEDGLRGLVLGYKRR